MINLTCLSLGVTIGIIYFINMRYSIKHPHKNCSFVTNKLTDILAFIIGIVLIYYGISIYNDNVLTIIGLAIITEHLLQFTYK